MLVNLGNLLNNYASLRTQRTRRVPVIYVTIDTEQDILIISGK